MRSLSATITCLVLCLYCGVLSSAQSANSGLVRGTVLDPSGAVVPGVTVEIQNPVSRFQRSAQTDAQGKFEFNNVPFNTYHLSFTAPSFEAQTQDLELRSTVPADLKISLQLGTTTTSVSVTAQGEDLIENDPVAHTDVDRALINKLPVESQSSSLSSVVTLSSPGVS